MKNDKKNKSGILARFSRNVPAVIGLVMFIVIILSVVIGGFVLDYEQQVIRNNPRQKFLPPSSEHYFGTDSVGRDVFARVLYGGRYSISIGLISTTIAIIIGAILGAACGYYGGTFDNVVMRIQDIMSSIPSLLFTLAIVSALGASFINLMIAMVFGLIPGFIRTVRATVISLSDVEYIQAARCYGTKSARIIIRHVMPNALGVIINSFAGAVAGMVLYAASLSYLGFGVQPPTPEWGVMLSDAKATMRQAPWAMIFPGLAILLTSLSINLIGDGLRDALDPRLKD